MDSGQNQTVLLQYNASAGEWLIGRDKYYSRISEDTFSTIWNNLSDAIVNNKSYIAVRFLEIIYDYFELIPEILPQFDVDEWIINQVEKDQRLDERQDIIDFITVLGGLLYFSNKLSELGIIFYFTQSHPPMYKAFLSATIRKCLELYCKMWSEKNSRYALIDIKYPFPTLVALLLGFEYM